MTSSGIEPATFRPVAQCLYQPEIGTRQKINTTLTCTMFMWSSVRYRQCLYNVKQFIILCSVKSTAYVV
jgi:hypothetical protein